MPSSVAMVTAAVRAEFHSSPASSMLSSEMAICVMLPKQGPLETKPSILWGKVSILSHKDRKTMWFLACCLLPSVYILKSWSLGKSGCTQNFLKKTCLSKKKLSFYSEQKKKKEQQNLPRAVCFLGRQMFLKVTKDRYACQATHCRLPEDEKDLGSFQSSVLVMSPTTNMFDSKHLEYLKLS